MIRPVKAERVKRHRAGTRQARGYNLSNTEKTPARTAKKLEHELRTMQEIERFDRLFFTGHSGGLPLGVFAAPSF
jgi:hypothetical protein